MKFSFFKRTKSTVFSSEKYWENRYSKSGNSGAGSYGQLAQFKADVINELVRKMSIRSVLEFGCGDGNQLTYFDFPRYTGLDVSPTALKMCIEKFKNDNSKSFFLYNQDCFVDKGDVFKHDAVMSLDVLYHLVEQEVYDTYLKYLFASARKVVVIYAADIDHPQVTPHERYRKFTKDIEGKITGWKLDHFIKNKYPAKDYEDQSGSLADFFIFTPDK